MTIIDRSGTVLSSNVNEFDLTLKNSVNYINTTHTKPIEKYKTNSLPNPPLNANKGQLGRQKPNVISDKKHDSNNLSNVEVYLIDNIKVGKAVLFKNVTPNAIIRIYDQSEKMITQLICDNKSIQIWKCQDCAGNKLKYEILHNASAVVGTITIPQ